MTSPSGSLSARLLVRAVLASLRLTDESVDSLTTSQLLAIQSKLGETFGILDSEIRDRERSAPGNARVVIDLSDWEDSETDEAADQQMRTSEDTSGSLPTPALRPTATPPGQATSNVHDAGDHGREVGIFADSASSTRAASTVPHEHQVEESA